VFQDVLKTLALAILLGASALPANAGSSNDGSANFVIRGAGGYPCGQWVHDHESSGRDARKLAQIDEAWLSGFLTGYNKWGGGGREDVLDNSEDISEATSWVTNYCETHSSDSIQTAASALIADRLDATGASGLPEAENAREPAHHHRRTHPRPHVGAKGGASRKPEPAHRSR